ncbi:MAG: TerB family tellurite resistance protein [Vulcanimicrobiota bacterium]
MKSKKEILTTLLGVATADGSFGPQEQAVIANILAKFGLDKSAPDAVPASGSGDHEQNLELMRGVFAVARADDILTPDELAYLEKIAGELGISPVELAQLQSGA